MILKGDGVNTLGSEQQKLEMRLYYFLTVVIKSFDEDAMLLNFTR